MMPRTAAIALAIVLAAMPAVAKVLPFASGSAAAIAAELRGRPHVIAFWSLTCPPCLAELPVWRRLVAEQGLSLVLVATDPVAETSRLEAMLARHGLDAVPAWAFADPFVEKLRFEVDRNWQGELPRAHLVGADGAVKVVTGMIDAAQVAAWWQRQKGDSHAIMPHPVH